jgi:hypothetical protein
MGTEQFLVTDATIRIGSWANSRAVKVALSPWVYTHPKAKCSKSDGFAMRTSHTTIPGTSYVPKLASHNQQRETRQASSMLPLSSPIDHSMYKDPVTLYNHCLYHRKNDRPSIGEPWPIHTALANRAHRSRARKRVARSVGEHRVFARR